MPHQEAGKYEPCAHGETYEADRALVGGGHSREALSEEKPGLVGTVNSNAPAVVDDFYSHENTCGKRHGHHQAECKNTQTHSLAQFHA